MIKSKLKTMGGVFLLLTFVFLACSNGSSGGSSDDYSTDYSTDFSPESKWQKGTYLAVCHNQKVQQVGTYEYLFEHPANRSVLTFLAKKKMIQNGTKWESVPENISYEEAIITSSGTNLIATTPSKTITIVGSNKDKLKNYEGESVWIYQTETSDKNIFFAKDESNPENEVNILETPDDSWKDLEIISKINNYSTNYNPTCIVVINDNSIHQIGEYLYIYNHPFNKTAALAAGPMSFIEVEVKKIENPNSTLDPFKIIVEYAGKTFIPIEQHQVDLYRGFYPSHETFVGKKITLGFRPEDFYYTETPSEENNIEIKVKSIEEFESFNYIHFMLGSKEMIAKIPKNDKSNFYIGETINIHPDITRCKFFVINTNPYEEKNICEKIDADWEKYF